ncbi:uncharacterized protein phf11 isoform X2 [Tachysurus fulvidraco]|uniref:uncharacterized protein phf11 isoform X2 n=1 Tax=Tachysurus fulvidraco TaxID=1234273 RepID=UPI001FEFAA4D|nr:uncharacterized protein phf11 isoform X2 [Tachysurus fulvidraco]
MQREHQRSSSSDLLCCLCKRADETEITGPLSCKHGTAAHQNCLLYASGIYCKNSPTYDDLFGFDVEDVEREARRGGKLKCHLCNKTGATAGCEVRSCKRSFHYPCAHKARAVPMEDTQSGIFRLYCAKHNPVTCNVENDRDGKEKDAESLPSSSDPKSSKDNNHAGSEENEMSFRRKRRYNEVYSDSSDETDLECAPIESEIEDNTPPDKNKPALDSKPRSKQHRTVTFTDDDVNRDSVFVSKCRIELFHEDNVPFTVITDSGTSVESVTENSPEPLCSSPPSPEGTRLSKMDKSFCASADDVILSPNPHSPTSPSLGYPLLDTMKEILDKEVSVKLGCRASLNEPPLMSSNDETPGSHSKRPHDRPLDLTSPGGCSQIGDPVGDVGVSDSAAALFWRRCNEVGCTEAIFTQLTRQISSLAEKVKNQHATQQDHAVSLRILEASGRLPEIFKQMEQDFEDQERQLKRKRQALRDAKAVLEENRFN